MNHDTKPKKVEFEEEIALPAYAIDRTEVTRGAFEIFEGMKQLTGLKNPPSEFLIEKNKTYPFGSAPSQRFPISGIFYNTARSYCRFLGKDLPTADQWQKAFRGGLWLKDGTRNPAPTRNTPSTQPVHLGPEIAPVGVNPDDVSPYGVVDLAGNLSEWSRDLSTNHSGLRRVPGGNWSSPPDKGFERVYHTNVRAEELTDFTIGVRCATLRPASP
jgi:formylglycine-generating enzyme required for sulfatase activity